MPSPRIALPCLLLFCLLPTVAAAGEETDLTRATTEQEQTAPGESATTEQEQTAPGEPATTERASDKQSATTEQADFRKHGVRASLASNLAISEEGLAAGLGLSADYQYHFTRKLTAFARGSAEFFPFREDESSGNLSIEYSAVQSAYSLGIGARFLAAPLTQRSLLYFDLALGLALLHDSEDASVTGYAEPGMGVDIRLRESEFTLGPSLRYVAFFSGETRANPGFLQLGVDFTWGQPRLERKRPQPPAALPERQPEPAPAKKEPAPVQAAPAPVVVATPTPPDTQRLEELLEEEVSYESNSYAVPEGGTPELRELAQELQNHPEVRIVVIGHADDRGTATYNQVLSEQRAQAVIDWLIAEGVSADQLELDGRGFNQPIAENSSEAGRAQNRRVEFHRLPMD